MKIHTTADVQTKNIGDSTIVWQYTIILANASIGDNCNINAHCFIENNVLIGNNVTIKCGVYLWDGIIIEDNVEVGPNVTFTNDLFPRSQHAFELKKTILKNGSSIGAGTTIIGGITIGEYALIGAGSVITKNIPPYTLWFGNPASQKGYVCECGHKLNIELTCTICNKAYKFDIQSKEIVPKND